MHARLSVLGLVLGLVSACTSSFRFEATSGSSSSSSSPSSPPPPDHVVAAAHEPAATDTGMAPTSASVPAAAAANDGAAAEPAAPPVDREAQRRRATKVAAQLEAVMTKVIGAFSRAKGNCKRAAATLRGVASRTKGARVAIERALADARTDDVFAEEWSIARAGVDARMERLGATVPEGSLICKLHPDVETALVPFRASLFRRVERAERP